MFPKLTTSAQPLETMHRFDASCCVLCNDSLTILRTDLLYHTIVSMSLTIRQSQYTFTTFAHLYILVCNAERSTRL